MTMESDSFLEGCKPGKSPTDIEELEGWGKRLESWFSRDREPSHFCRMIFLESRGVEAAMMRLEQSCPYAIHQIRDKVDFCKKWEGRLDSDPAATQNLAEGMHSLMQTLRSAAATLRQEDGPAKGKGRKGKAKKKKPGPPPLPLDEARGRITVLAKWKGIQDGQQDKPRHERMRRAEFAEAEGITVKDLQDYQAWLRRRKDLPVDPRTITEKMLKKPFS